MQQRFIRIRFRNKRSYNKKASNRAQLDTTININRTKCLPLLL